jgi:hypothetical protein
VKLAARTVESDLRRRLSRLGDEVEATALRVVARAALRAQRSSRASGEAARPGIVTNTPEHDPGSALQRFAALRPG